MNGRIPLTVLSLSLLLAACGQQPATGSANTPQPVSSAPTDRSRTEAPVLGTDNPQAIPGQYIVVFSEGVQQADLSAQSAGGLIKSLNLDPQGISVLSIYSQALHGFSAKLSAQNLQTLRADKRIKYIEQDSIQHAFATQSNATWGLDRIDQTSLPLNGTYNYANTGSGVTAYILDTGINTSHQDFGGRAVWGINTSGDGNNTDCAGHGTHVAGTVGSNTWGVAKGVKLVAVKVLGCDGRGSMTGILNGMNWVASNKSGPAVANMSLGGGYSRSENDAVANLSNKGIVMVVAAGNENQDACNVSPASAPAAITVGATMKNDRRPDYNDWGYTQTGQPQGSNWGTCLDIFAPGDNISSTWIGTSTGSKLDSGTSMASPHVAGAAALVLAANPTYTSTQVASALLTNSITGKVTNAAAGSPNKLLYTGFIGGGNDTPTDPPPPVNVFTGYVSSGSSAYAPSASGVNTYGTLTAKLTGPAGTDFDLYLQKWNGSTWVDIAASEGAGSTESLTYTNAPQGLYRLEVYSYSGSGNYRLETN